MKFPIIVTLILALFYIVIFTLSVLGKKKDEAGQDISSTEVVEEEKKYKATIILDPGHGGRDPGKVGENNVLEKDINLSIALKTRDKLVEDGYKVIMTRQDDHVYGENESKKKEADLNNRLSLINDSNADMVVCIHQNSYIDNTVRGAQTFYYEDSEEGAMMAELLQEKIVEKVDALNTRQKKGNKSFYMLKESEKPIVILECGFLSNEEEKNNLVSEEYQQRIAIAINEAINQYINIEEKENN